jgi:hypothetical protein
MDSDGKLVMESILETKAATILQFLAGLAGHTELGSADLPCDTEESGWNDFS